MEPNDNFENNLFKKDTQVEVRLKHLEELLLKEVQQPKQIFAKLNKVKKFVESECVDISDSFLLTKNVQNAYSTVLMDAFYWPKETMKAVLKIMKSIRGVDINVILQSEYMTSSVEKLFAGRDFFDHDSFEQFGEATLSLFGGRQVPPLVLEKMADVYVSMVKLKCVEKYMGVDKQKDGLTAHADPIILKIKKAFSFSPEIITEAVGRLPDRQNNESSQEEIEYAKAIKGLMGGELGIPMEE